MNLEKMGPFERVAFRLGHRVKSRNQETISALCPAHDDNRPSLSVRKAQDGTVLLKCHAGCNPERILSAIGLTLSDLFVSRGSEPTHRKPEKSYDYTDETGKLVYQAIRLPGKNFRFRRPSETGGWLWKLNGVPRIPYRLPQLLQAPEEATIFVTEGEKDADRLNSMGLVATTNPGGAGKWGRLHRKTVKKAFQGRKVAIVADNDEPGRAHAEHVARQLQPWAASITLIFLPGLPEKGDVSDYLDSGATKEDLLELVASAAPWSSLDLGPPEDDQKHPEIIVSGGNLPQAVDEAEKLLLADRGIQIYQRGNLLVRVVRTAASTARGWFRRVPGALIITPVTAPFLVERLTKAARWIFVDARGNSKVIDCPEKVSKTYLAREGIWRVPNLVGILETPSMRPDGTLIVDPGYDPATGLYLDLGKTAFPSIPENPTLDDAIETLGELLLILKDFPFVAGSDRSAALAAILTAIVRKSLRTAPVFAFCAPQMGSGKSLLADIVSIIATGRVASVMSQGHDETEDQKRMLALLLEGEAVACIDNIDRPFGNATICSVLTQESWKGRVLGFSRNATVPTATTWLATGNNIVFVGDITTRVVLCDLDPKCEKPEERVFDVDLYKHVPKVRGRLVLAALTVLRAYHVAGRPSQDLSVWGRFEEWSDFVRSALVWAGEADPCEGMKRIEEIDPVRRQLRMLLLTWFEEFRDRAVTSAEVVRACEENSTLQRVVVEATKSREARPGTRSLGNFLSHHEKRLEQGLRIERAGQRQGAVLWRVLQVQSEPVGSVSSVSQSDSAQEKTNGEDRGSSPELVEYDPRNSHNSTDNPIGDHTGPDAESARSEKELQWEL